MKFSPIGQKLLLDSSLGLPIRLSETLRVARRDAKAAREIASAMEATTLHASNFFRAHCPKPKSDTLFILGSGPSISELSKSNFEEIGSQWSVGISHWLVHPFIPDAYSIEQVENDTYQHVAQLFSDRLQDISCLDNPPCLLYLRPRGGLGNQAEINIPKGLTERTFIYGRHNPVTRESRAAKQDLQFVFSKLGQLVLPSNVLQDSGSSVFRMVSLAIRSGVRKIVLLGVDLNSPNYFFEAPGELERFGLPSNYDPETSRGSRHATDYATNRPLTFSAIIKVLAELGVESGMWKIFAGSKHSALAEFLPLYAWREDGFKMQTPSRQ